MFSNLRPNNQIYILHKNGKPSIEIGNVISVSAPKPKWSIPPQYGQPQEMVVDLIAKIGEQSVTYQSLPAALDIADSAADGVVVTTGREAMNAEIAAARQRSIDIINSRSYHEEQVAAYDEILEQINPEYAEKQAQADKMSKLEQRLDQVTQNMENLMAFLQKKTGSGPDQTNE